MTLARPPLLRLRPSLSYLTPILSITAIKTMKRFSFFTVALFTGLLALTGCSGDPNLEGARLDMRNGDFERALENVNEALASDSANAEAYLVKGQILQQQSASLQDAEEHAQAVRDMAQAFERAVELDPELEGDVQTELTRAYVQEFELGGQAFNRASGGAAADTSGDGSEVSGEVGYEAAAMYFGNAAEIMPDSSGPYLNQAYALINAGMEEEAIEPFEMAIEKGADEPESYLYLSDLYIRSERAEDAVTLLEEARSVHSGNTEIQSQLLNAYVTSGQMDRAMDTYREAVESEPSNKTYRYNLGSLLLQAEDYEGAIEQLQEAVNLDPEYASAQYNLGAAYVNRAVDANEQVQVLDDSLRAGAANLSQEEIAEIEADMETLADERMGYFDQAVGPLERAQELTEAEGGDAQEICRALFSAYVQTQQQDKAEALSECAGYEDMN